MVNQSLIQEVIGFDLGHSETKATKISLDSNNPGESPRLLEILPESSSKHILTAVAFDPTGETTYIGENALRANKEGVKHQLEFAISFKREPIGDLSYQLPMRRFLQAVYKTMTTRGVISRTGHLFFVGCPSGWPDHKKEEFKQILHDVGIPAEVVPESRAAMMHALETNSGRVNQKGLGVYVLLIDVGSSTTDFTLVKANREVALDFGYNLGGSIIDRLIFAQVLKNHPKRQELEKIFDLKDQQSRSDYMSCELACRHAKEAYFNNQLQNAYFGGYSIETNKGEIIEFAPRIDSHLIHLVFAEKIEIPGLGILTWEDAYREALSQVKRKLVGKQVAPTTLIITGGSARFDFIETISHEVFPNAEFSRSEEPEYSITRGLAQWGRVMLLTRQFQEEVNIFCKTKLNLVISEMLPDLFGKISIDLTKYIVGNIFKPAVRCWRDGNYKTIQEMQEDIQKNLTKWFDSRAPEQAIDQTIRQYWYPLLQSRILADIKPICDRYHTPVEKIFLSGSISLDMVETMDKQMGKDLNLLHSLTSTAQIPAVILGVIGLFFWEISGIIGIIGLILYFFGRLNTDDVATQFEKIPIPIWLRKKLVSDEKIEEQMKENQLKCQNGLNQRLLALTDLNQKMVIGIGQDVSSSIKAYVDQVLLLPQRDELIHG